MKIAVVIFLLFSFPLAFAAHPQRPDIRHMNDDILDAAPTFEHFEDFLSKLDLNDDWEDLEEEYQEREEKIKLLENINLKSLSIGKRFKVHEELMELLGNQVTYLRLKTETEFYEKYQLWLIEKVKDKPSLYSKKLETYRLKILDIARTMASNYKTLEGEDTQATLIKNLARNGNENFEFYFKNFKKSFPKSKHITLLNHSVGEYYFLQKKYKEAESYFKEALADKSANIRPYIAYKLAWTYQLLLMSEKSKNNQAVYAKKTDASFRLVFKLLDDWSEWKPVYNLKSNAAQDLAWFWAMSEEGEDKVVKYFDDIDQMKNITDYYYFYGFFAGKNGKRDLSQKYFSKLENLSLESRKLPDQIIKQIELAFQTGDLEAILANFKKLEGIFDKKHPWFDEFEDEKDLISLNRDRFEYFLRNQAVQIHQNGHNLKQQAAQIKNKKQQEESLSQANSILNGAVALYSLYEDNFSKDSHYEDIVFNHSNLLYDLGKHEEASKLFSLLGDRKDSKYRKDAAYNAVMSAYNADSQAPQTNLPEAGKAQSPIPLSKSKSLLIEKIDYFVKNFPNTPELPQTAFTAAQIYYEHGQYPEAFQRFHQLILKAPRSSEGESALRTVLSYYWEAKNWEQVVKISSKYIIEPAVVAAGHEKFLQETLSYAQSQLAISKK